MELLHLDLGLAVKAVNVHPVVLFSVLDHHIRRKEGERRVIGTLLGYVEDGVVHVRNCFPVPHTEVEQVAVDMTYHKNMYELHQKTNLREEIVGWYASGTDVNEHSVLLHNFYAQEMSTSPIHLCVGTDLLSGKMGISAYIGTPYGLDSSEVSLGTRFQPLPIVHADRTEFTGLATLIDLKREDPAQSVNLLSTQNVREALANLEQRLAAVTKYVDDVVAGKVEGDVKVGRYLHNTVATFNYADVEEFQRICNSSMQDQLMAIYVSDLMRTQMYVMKKLVNVPV